MKPECSLLHARARSAQSPSTFQIPSEADLATLAIGHYAKLCVSGFSAVHGRQPVRAERFWVRVEDLGEMMTGTVEQSDMHLTGHHGVAHGDRIIFHRDHILSIWNGAE